jgi:hypothetical protein
MTGLIGTSSTGAAGYLTKSLRARSPPTAPAKYKLVINLKTANSLGPTSRPPCSPAPTR